MKYTIWVKIQFCWLVTLAISCRCGVPGNHRSQRIIPIMMMTQWSENQYSKVTLHLWLTISSIHFVGWHRRLVAPLAWYLRGSPCPCPSLKSLRAAVWVKRHWTICWLYSWQRLRLQQTFKLHLTIMLQPPLSLVSNDLLGYIVESIAGFHFADENLYNLSLTDRAFTQFCQKYIFRELRLWDSSDLHKRLKKLKKILDDKPSFANQVRLIDLSISRNDSAWLFEDRTFNSLLQLFAKSPVPPYQLE